MSDNQKPAEQEPEIDKQEESVLEDIPQELSDSEMQEVQGGLGRQRRRGA